MTWKCAYCGGEYDSHLHGDLLSIPVCKKCAHFYVLGVTAGNVAASEMIDIDACIDVSIMKMVNDGIIPADSVTRMGVRE